MMNQSRAVAYWTLGRSDLLSMDMADKVRTAVTPGQTDLVLTLLSRSAPTKCNTVRGGLSVEPEANPAENYNESTGQIDLRRDSREWASRCNMMYLDEKISSVSL